MKNILSFLLIVSTFGVFASVYTLDEEALETEFHDLNLLEEQVKQTAFDSLKMEGLKASWEKPFVAADPLAMNVNQEFYFDWGSFAWGFCCCPVGLFTVALNNNADQDMKHSYWIGTGVILLLSLGFTAFSASANGSASCVF